MVPARHLLGVASGALLVTSVVGLVTRDDPAPSAPSGPGEVLITDFAYGPEALSIAVGTTITWTNDDTADHTVTSDDDTGLLDSGSIDTGGATFEQTFDEPGSFTYFCAFHPFMKGSVEVTG
jgi:plastocyanin